VLQEFKQRHQHTGGAEPTLKAMVIVKGLLQRMQLPILASQALDRSDDGAISLHGKHKATTYRLSVDQHRAGATNTVLATDMGSSEINLMTQAIGQGKSRLDLNVVTRAING
jgi:hypothetical protein